MYLAVFTLFALSCTPSLKASTAVALACDWAGTSYRISHAGPNEQYETNPILGGRPSQGALAVYIVSSAVVIEVVGRLLPEDVQPMYYGTTTFLETLVDVNAYYHSGVPVLGRDGNVHRNHAPVCGL